jgi:hypothetical protein
MTLRRNLAGFSDLALNEAIKVSFKHHRLLWRQLDALKFARSEQLIDGGFLKAKPATKFRQVNKARRLWLVINFHGKVPCKSPPHCGAPCILPYRPQSLICDRMNYFAAK